MARRLPGLHGSDDERRRPQVRTRNDKTQVLDGPYAETKEQLGGFHIIEVADLDAALSWAARSPTALHGVVEVRPLREGTLLTGDMSRLMSPE